MLEVDILAMGFTERNPRPGVYLLVQADTVIYVGSSTLNVEARLAEQCRSMPYDRAFIIFCLSPEEACRLELKLYKLYKPPLNKMQPYFTQKMGSHPRRKARMK